MFSMQLFFFVFLTNILDHWLIRLYFKLLFYLIMVRTSLDLIWTLYNRIEVDIGIRTPPTCSKINRRNIFFFLQNQTEPNTTHSLCLFRTLSISYPPLHPTGATLRPPWAPSIDHRTITSSHLSICHRLLIFLHLLVRSILPNFLLYKNPRFINKP